MPHLRNGASPPQYCAHRALEKVVTDAENTRSKNWVGLVLRDIQFWVPVAVLVAGLVVLRWIS
jgi:hypothetical protein